MTSARCDIARSRRSTAAPTFSANAAAILDSSCPWAACTRSTIAWSTLRTSGALPADRRWHAVRFAAGEPRSSQVACGTSKPRQIGAGHGFRNRLSQEAVDHARSSDFGWFREPGLDDGQRRATGCDRKMGNWRATEIGANAGCYAALRLVDRPGDGHTRRRQTLSTGPAMASADALAARRARASTGAAPTSPARRPRPRSHRSSTRSWHPPRGRPATRERGPGRPPTLRRSEPSSPSRMARSSRLRRHRAP
jgi:hypothetical protein